MLIPNDNSQEAGHRSPFAGERCPFFCVESRFYFRRWRNKCMASKTKRAHRGAAGQHWRRRRSRRRAISLASFFIFARKARVLRGAGHADIGKRRDFLKNCRENAAIVCNTPDLAPALTHPPLVKKIRAGDRTPAEGQAFTARAYKNSGGGFPLHYRKSLFHYSLNKTTVRESSRCR